MRTSTKVWLALALISNIGMFFLFSPLLNTIKYSETGGVSFVFTLEAYIGLVLFVLANISGFIVIARFLKTQPLSSQIFFSIVPPTITFFMLFLFFFTINTAPQTEIVSAVKFALNINTESSKYVWFGVIGGAYVLFIIITSYFISKPLKRIEKVTEVLKYGKSRKQIKVGGGSQFQNIEYDLNVINENYKESDKIIKKIDPIIIKEAVEEANPKADNDAIANLIIAPTKK
ncbi:MAG: hypothetical protein PHS54_02540 [Clostridia bacterium]|nr:hypothetical protein [Clostridia bacterium]